MRALYELHVLVPVPGSDGVQADFQFPMIDAEEEKLWRSIRIERYKSSAQAEQFWCGVADFECQRLVFAQRLPVYVADRCVERDCVYRAAFRLPMNADGIAIIGYIHSRQFRCDANQRFVERLLVELIVEHYRPLRTRFTTAVFFTVMVLYDERVVGR